MKYRLIFLAMLLCMVCCKDNPTEPANRQNIQIVDLVVGNVYVYWEGEYDEGIGDGASGPYYIIDSLTIGSETWYNFDDVEYRRADASKLYLRNGTASMVELDYSLHPGDNFTYHNMPLVMKSVNVDTVFGQRELVFEARYSNASADTTYYLLYATRFGVLFAGASEGTYSQTMYLEGTKIRGKIYGDPLFIDNKKKL